MLSFLLSFYGYCLGSDSRADIKLIILSLLLGIVCILIFTYFILYLILKARKKKIRTILRVSQRRANRNSVRNVLYVRADLEPPESSEMMQVISGVPKIEKSSIQHINKLGEGNFGIVFHGKVMLNDEMTDVAVKTLKKEMCGDVLDSFVKEAKLMVNFDHMNIVKILGVAMESPPYSLVFEFMDRGDLEQFLRANSGRLQHAIRSNNCPSLNHKQLKDMCKQIASGMQYLASKKHIHCDLACRNCLVKSCRPENQTDCGFIVKIGDFGMSHQLYGSNYFRATGTVILPVRWLSPEAIMYGKFTTESDVWSFGVVMWEVFSFAMLPYNGLSNDDAAKAIKEFTILEQPTNCPVSIYEIMKKCWDAQTSGRPTFKNLCDQLDKLIMSVSSSNSSARNVSAHNASSSITLSVISSTAYSIRHSPSTATITLESIGEESIGEESIGGQSVGEQSVGEQSVGEQSVGEQSVGEQSVGEQSVGEQSVGGQSVGEQSVGEQSVGEQSVGEQSVGEQSVGEQSVGEQSVGEQSVGEQSVGEQSVGEQSVGEQSVGGQSVGEQSVGEQSVGEQSVGEQSVGGQSVGEQSVGEQSVGEQSVGEQSVGEQSVGEQSVGEQSVGGQSVGGQSVGEQSVGEQSVGEQSVGEQSVGEQSVGEQSVGEQSVGEQSVGEQSVGEQSVGEQSVGEQSVGECTTDLNSVALIEETSL